MKVSEIKESKERTFRTFPAWKSALRKLDSSVTFEGDKDIAQAFVTKNGKKSGVGEWDGETGTIYDVSNKN